MKNIIAFAGSNSSVSINKKLVTYASGLLEEVKVDILDLNNFDLPLYGIDLEKEKGIHAEAKRFKSLIDESDGIMLSLAEHNGAYSTVFKNLFDWLSRIEKEVFSNKPMLLMAASPGPRGGASVLQIAMDRFPRMGAKIVDSFSLPSFPENFRDGEIVNKELNNELKEKVQTFKNTI
ncbi:NAD(P)H-dependent FMN reductase [Flavobacteriaceae bacterium MAR_2010_188]|nr:NAD(P)H-dependent FMN reductase [Flavobacteriaceae bacterium MAR_2010_188]